MWLAGVGALTLRPAGRALAVPLEYIGVWFPVQLQPLLQLPWSTGDAGARTCLSHAVILNHRPLNGGLPFLEVGQRPRSAELEGKPVHLLALVWEFGCASSGSWMLGLLRGIVVPSDSQSPKILRVRVWSLRIEDQSARSYECI